jgi:tRNA-specific 2-thiouridylase
LQSAGCEIENMHWLATPSADGDRVSVKLRYRQADQSAVWSAPGTEQGRLQFVVAQRAVTPGQFAVIYAGTRCLGGGVITRTHTLAAAEPTAAIISALNTA